MKQIIEEIINNPGFNKLVLSNKRKKSAEVSKVMLRPVMVKGEKLVQVEYTYEKKVTHDNLRFCDAVNLAVILVTEDFKQINALTSDEEIQILANKVEKPYVTRKKIAFGGADGSKLGKSDKESIYSMENLEDGQKERPAKISESKMPSIDLSNNRTKNYIIPDGIPCDFLIKLGVMGEDGKVFQRAYSKFRQINRYLEIVEDCYPALCNVKESVYQKNSEGVHKQERRTEEMNSSGSETDKPLKIIDFGCGKAYLTFALYHYLKNIKNRNVEIIGLDLKKDVIEFCNGVASDLGYDELKFLMGDIADYTNDHADMVVTLHACDTATDYAFINAVSWGTKVILSVPCCQHELFKQIKNDIHDPMLKHGILKDRLTEYLTDGLRALKLEAKGYDVAMIEFTSLEHTARNIMIKAVMNRPSKKRMEKAQAEYEALRDFYHVSPTIDKL